MKKISYEILHKLYHQKNEATINPFYSYLKITSKDIKEMILPYFLMDTLCIGFIIKGEIEIELNKVPYCMKKGTAFYELGKVIIQINHVSNDFEMLLVSTNEQIRLKVISEIGPSQEKNTSYHPIVELNDFLLQFSLSTMDLLKNKPADDGLCFEISTGICIFLTNLFKHTSSNNTQKNEKLNYNYQQQIFQQFQHLVKKHYLEERSVSFYAEKLCITRRSLGNIIKEFSGYCAKDWIDKAVITQAKILLAYSSKNILQISEEMNFNTLATFTVFFKRMTNQTPSEYRKQTIYKSKGSVSDVE